MLRHVFNLNKPVRSILYRFSHVSTLFNIQNREHLFIKPQKPNNLNIDDVQIPKQLIQQQQKNNISVQKVQDKDIDAEDHEQLEVNENQEQSGADLEEEEFKELQTAENIIQELKQKLTTCLSQGKFNKFQKLVSSGLKKLDSKHLKETDLLELFRVIRSYRIKQQNRLLFTQQLQSQVKQFLTDKPKNNKVLRTIIQNWQTYDYPTLLKLTSLYRYLPNQVIRSSLQKLFDISPTSDLGYIKHFDIMNQLMNKQQRIQLGHLPHKLIQGRELFSHTFNLSYTDLEVIIKFFHKYNVYTSSKMIGGVVFHQLTMMLRPERKGYKFDFELFKQICNIYWGCVNMKSKIRVKFIEDIPQYLLTLLGNNSGANEHLKSLLDAFDITSNFSNCNSYYGRAIQQAIGRCEPQEIKAIMPQILKYMDSLLQSMKPEYCLNSMEAPANNTVKESVIGAIKGILPQIVDSYLLEFLKYEFDPYIYDQVLFRSQDEYKVYLDKYLYLLQQSHPDSLKILKHLHRCQNLIDFNDTKLKQILESSWKKLSKQNHKWPQCLPYYFYYISLSKNSLANLKDINKHIESLVTKIQKYQKDTAEKKLLPLVVNSRTSSIQFLLPILSLTKPQLIKNSYVKKLILEQIIPTIRRWDAIDFYHNLKVLVNHFDSLPKEFINAMLENSSVLTLIDKEETYIHPDIDRTLIQQFVKLILNNYKKLDLQTIDLKVFQMFCVIVKKSLDDNLIKKILEMLGLKQQKYIVQMINVLQNFEFKNQSELKQLQQLIPSHFNNVMINNYIKKYTKKEGVKVKSSRQIKKQLSTTLDNPKQRLKQQYDYDKLETKQEKGLYLINRLYESIIKPDNESEIEQIQNKISKLYPVATELSHDMHLLNVQEQQKMSVYDQFVMNERKAINNKFQLMKIKEYLPTLDDETCFESVDLFALPMQEQLLRNASRPTYIENQVIPKLNEDISPAFESLKSWFQKLGVTAKLRNNAIMLKGGRGKSWSKTVVLIIAKPEVFKINLVSVYLINRVSDAEFVVIEEESNIETTIKNYIYKKNNVIM